jgi:hypothetical protein
MEAICTSELHGVTTQTTALFKYLLLSTCIVCLQTREDLGADEREDLRNYTNSVRTVEETHYGPAAKPIRLILFRETVAVYCENHTEHNKYTLRGQNVDFLIFKA